MNRVIRSLFLFSLVALIASPLAAQEEKKAKKKAAQQGRGSVIAGQLAGQLEKANLTDEQKKQIEDIKTKYAAKVNEARASINAVLPREQRQARQAALKKAREEGKKGDELKAAVDAAVVLSDEQKKSLADAEAKMQTVQTEIRQAVLAVLTDEQKQALGLNKGQGKKKKKDNAAQADKPAKGDKAAKAADKGKAADKNANQVAVKGGDKGSVKGDDKAADKNAVKGDNKDPKGAK